MAKRKRRAFTNEFKAEAVRLVRDSGKSVPTVARELDLTETALRSWVRQAEVDAGRGPAGALTTEERAELAQLRRENRTLRMERDILKTFGHGSRRPICWTRNSQDSHAGVAREAVAVCLMVRRREPVKKHGPGVACALEIGDAVEAIPFMKVICGATPALEGTQRRPGMPGSKKPRGRSSGRLSTINPDAAGLDVGSTFHVAAVPADRDDQPVRTFRSFSGDLHRLAEWLTAAGITTVAMESTGIYWIPVFEILEARGFHLLVNARDVKNVPGRKTDVNDAQWLQQLHQHGLLRGSFRPRDGVVRLRAYLRHRERLVDYAASHIQHMQKALMEMNVQLQRVVFDITGVTGMRIIRAIVAGTQAPATLAEFRDVRCAASEETIRDALTGNYRAEHVFVLRHALELYDVHQTKIAEGDTEIAAVLRTLNEERPAA